MSLLFYSGVYNASGISRGIVLWFSLEQGHKLYSTETQTSLSLAYDLLFKGHGIHFYSCYATQAGC